jgi:hypothetical protein
MVTFEEEEIENTLLYLLHTTRNTTAKPECILSLSNAQVPPHCAQCDVNISTAFCSSATFTVLIKDR